MPEKISILKESGEVLNSNIVSIFSIPESEKKYIITTENAVDPHGLTVFHVSEIVGDELVKVSTDEEWSAIKTIMRSIISGSVGSFQYQPLIEKANVKGQYSRDISVSSSAAKQMTDNYNNALKTMKEQIVSVPVNTPSVSVSNSIFPTDTVQPTEENEVIPGIAEVSTDENSTPTEGGISPVSNTFSNTGLSNEVNLSNVDSSNLNVVSVATPVPNAALDQGNIPAPVNVVQAGETSTEGSSISNLPVVDEVSTVSSIEPVQIGSQNDEMATNISPSNLVGEVYSEDISNKDLRISPVEPVNVEVQLSREVSPIVPEAQIAQSYSNVVNLSLGDISRASNVEEIVQIVSGAFSESLRTILNVAMEMRTDLSQKEKILNEREATINQREKMINDQLMVMMNNFSTMKQASSPQDDTGAKPVA